jgi:hypothetical protein
MDLQADFSARELPDGELEGSHEKLLVGMAGQG